MTIRIVIHLIATSFYGGPEKQIVEHIKRLNKSLYKGMVVSFNEGGDNNEILERAESAKIVNFGIDMNGPLDWKAQAALNRLVRGNKVDLVCAHGYKAAVMGWVAAKINNIPIVTFSRGYTSENLKVRFYEWLEQRILERSNGVVCVSAGQKRKLESLNIKMKKSWVVLNSVSVGQSDVSGENIRSQIFKELNVPLESILIVTAGRLSPEKGHRYLLEAISHLKNQSEKLFFLFCGDGTCKEELEKQAELLGVGECCGFVGFRRDINEIFQAMDLFVLPSLTEGLPNVILESFACSKPVVSTSVGGVPEIVEDGLNGLLVPSGDPVLMAEAIDKVISESSLRVGMGEAGYNTVKERFSFEEQAQKLESIYKEVLLDGR